MTIKANTPEEYIASLSDERKDAFLKLRDTIKENLPNGFEELISYGMLTFAVPLSTYPSGYHCDPKQPLMLVSIASQKNFIALYHMGLYADSDLHKWFVEEYPKYSKTKIDMGKSCVRFKKMDQIPYQLIAELSKKISPESWVRLYEEKFKK